LVGGLAIAVAAGAVTAVTKSLPGITFPHEYQIAWSGRPTAPWPAAQLSYGRAHTEDQLIDYAIRVGMAAPARAPRPHEWIAVKAEVADSSGGGGGFLFGPPDKRYIFYQWFRADGCWIASGVSAPATFPPGKRAEGKIDVSPSGSSDDPSPAGCGGTVSGWPSDSYSYLASLPDDPAKLENIIARDNPEAPPRYGPPETRDERVFDAIAILFENEVNGTLVPPKLAATLYQVLKRLPNVQFDPATDLAGRTGLGFSLVEAGWYQQNLVIDPTTYTYMGDKSVAVTAHTFVGTDGSRSVEAGHVLGWIAVLGTAIVEKPGQMP
jgi:hypothetical protein